MEHYPFAIQAALGWKKKFVGAEINQIRQLKRLQEENGKLKKVIAKLSLDNVAHYYKVASNSVVGYITPKGMLAGYQQNIQAERSKVEGREGSAEESPPAGREG